MFVHKDREAGELPLDQSTGKGSDYFRHNAYIHMHTVSCSEDPVLMHVLCMVLVTIITIAAEWSIFNNNNKLVLSNTTIL